MKRIMKCPKDDTYTLRDICPICKEKTVNPKPAKFSIEDKYGKYRRIARKRLF